MRLANLVDETTSILTIQEAEELCAHALHANDVSLKNSQAIARVYIEAELCGKVSHGLKLVPWLLQQLKETSPEDPEIVETSTTVFIDGKENPGPPIAELMVERLLFVMEKNEVAVGGIRNAGHVGMLGYYARKITDHNLIALICATTPSVTVPFGGTEPVLGTNPICIGVPFTDGPIILDTGTTALTYHSLLQAKTKGELLKPESVLDTSGQPTQDAGAADPTRLLPFGGHKGFGLSFMIEILTGALTGWKVGQEKAKKIANDRFSTIFIVISPDVFASAEEFATRVQRLLSDTAASQGLDAARIPGSEANRLRAQSLERGSIEIASITLQTLQSLSK